MANNNDSEKHLQTAFRYDHDGDELRVSSDDVRVIDSTLASGSKALSPSERADLITRIRGGAHHELTLTAITFRQKDGSPNRNFMRFKPSKLPALAKSFTGVPVLLDHDKRSSSARIGTILSSEAIDQPGGWTAFRQTLHIVKPDAVISVLDGTIDRFSIGWHPTGAVNCSVHGKDIRQAGSCRCWPGDRPLDGGGKVVEYEVQQADGIETSSVNVPAVLGTRNEDIRIALALELGLSHRIEKKEISKMNWSRLATLLGLASISEADEDRVLAAVDARIVAGNARAQAAEVALAADRTDGASSRASLVAELAVEKAARTKAEIDLLIIVSTHEGKIRPSLDAAGVQVPDPLEGALRAIATTGGIDQAKLYASQLFQRFPVGKAPEGLNTNGPDRTVFSNPGIDDALSSAASQLGLDPAAVKANHTATKGR